MVLVNRRSPSPVMVMGMTRVDEAAYITVGVGELRFTNASDGNGELIIEWFGVRDFQLGGWEKLIKSFYHWSQRWWEKLEIRANLKTLRTIPS